MSTATARITALLRSRAWVLAALLLVAVSGFLSVLALRWRGADEFAKGVRAYHEGRFQDALDAFTTAEKAAGLPIAWNTNAKEMNERGSVAAALKGLETNLDKALEAVVGRHSCYCWVGKRSVAKASARWRERKTRGKSDG